MYRSIYLKKDINIILSPHNSPSSNPIWITNKGKGLLAKSIK